METIGLRELNHNPSRAVARVRAGVPLVVTDRGKPVLRMVPEPEPDSTLALMLTTGDLHPPIEQGMPSVIEDLLPEIDSLSDVLLTEREKERNR